ncbi:hypothetical protein HRbin35_00260 [bacterium HR35]|nr:hypothetical protein HRbin35_00260 [bacterium HR35]
MRKRKKKFRFSFSLFLLIFLISVFSYLLVFKKIKNFIIDPPEKLSLISSYLENKSFIEIYFQIKKILKENPNIVYLELKPVLYPFGVKIKIKEAKVIAQIYDFKNQEIYYLDNYGRIAKNLKQDKRHFLEIISFKKIQNNSLLHPKLQKLFSILFEIANLKNFYLKQIKIYSNFDVGVINNQNQEFLFDPNKDVEEQIKKFIFFLDFQNKEQLKNITRIDLRIPKKIYFR